MKLLTLFLCISVSVFAQDFANIKSKTDNYSGMLTVEELTNNIKTDFKSEENQVKALFSWLTKNIRYDLEEFYNPKNKRTSFRYRTLEEKENILQALKDVRVNETLSSRKAVCEGYAQTFAKVCNLLEIENEVIKGYARSSYNDIGKPIEQPNHAWNAVKINNQWIYVDATWGAGHQNNGKWLRKFKPYFYDIKKETYFKTHLPEDTVWRLRIERMDKTVFYNQPIYSHHFLTSDYELLHITSGFLKKDKDGKVQLSLKNVPQNKKIHFGFIGEKFAKKPEIEINNKTTTVSIIPPKNATEIYLLIDLEVMVNFKII